MTGVCIFLVSYCTSSHRYGLVLELDLEIMGGLSKGLGSPCIAVGNRSQLEDREMLKSARMLELKYSEAVPALREREKHAVQ